jgi:hypothetical protein
LKIKGFDSAHSLALILSQRRIKKLKKLIILLEDTFFINHPKISPEICRWAWFQRMVVCQMILLDLGWLLLGILMYFNNLT